jgi:hypothetical protein
MPDTGSADLLKGMLKVRKIRRVAEQGDAKPEFLARNEAGW